MPEWHALFCRKSSPAVGGPKSMMTVAAGCGTHVLRQGAHRTSATKGAACSIKASARRSDALDSFAPFSGGRR